MSVGASSNPPQRNFKWKSLLRRIEEGKVTPFLGAGACAGFLPLGRDVARTWAEDTEWPYPFDNSDDLVGVAQYLAVMADPMEPKERIVEMLEDAPEPSEDVDPIHSALAELPLPLYMTTNYDGFMMRALKRKYRNPRQEFCRWNSYLQNPKSLCDAPDFVLDRDKPMVFHLHGTVTQPRSIVISEDDYVEFLVRSREDWILPAAIKNAFTDTVLMFIGYRMADWNFRVLFQTLQQQLSLNVAGVDHISVQLEPDGKNFTAEKKKAAQAYFEKHFNQKRIQIYWGDARQFMQELVEQWRAYCAPTGKK
jgi:hypothetical protein